MVKVLIGAGGWDYFNVPGDRLRNYARAFKTVEVNSTFYTIPPLSLVESWRKRVPENFEFTVRCNRQFTQRLQFAPLDLSLELFDRMKQICSILRADILHIQTPLTLKFTDEVIEKIDNFLSAISLSNPRLAWEIRTHGNADRHKLLSSLKRYDVIHSVDLSREDPAYESNIIYSRLFGRGVHNIYQFTNVELEEIDRKVKESKAEKAYLNFHGTRMYKDAARISIYEATGKFPKVTHDVGVESILEVLREDAKFPSSTSELIKHQGWKVCEWKNDQQLHVSEILSSIKEKRFNDISELEVELHKLKL